MLAAGDPFSHAHIASTAATTAVICAADLHMRLTGLYG
jgi:hypothetical protein